MLKSLVGVQRNFLPQNNVTVVYRLVIKTALQINLKFRNVDRFVQNNKKHSTVYVFATFLVLAFNFAFVCV